MKTFDDRKRASKLSLLGFLDRFTPPRGMSDAAQSEMVDSISEAFARKLPVSSPEYFAECLKKTFDAVADSHESYSWPPQGVFVKCLHVGQASASASPETFEPKEDRGIAVIEDRFLAGEGVNEKYVWGPHSTSVMASGKVSREIMDGYRRASVRSYLETYRSSAQEMMIENFGVIVEQYFQNRTPQEVAE